MKDNSVPAFPTSYFDVDIDKVIPDFNGMTLRDYFAAKALQGMLSREASIRYDEKDVAKACYGFADAMLTEREK